MFGFYRYEIAKWIHFVQGKSRETWTKKKKMK